MKIAVFSTRSYDRESLSQAAASNATFHESHYFCFHEVHLSPETVHLAKGHDAICAFVNDRLNRAVLETLQAEGIQLVALRCAGYNNVDLIAANDAGITVARVPAYSPEAVAEHTVALILALNRKIYRSYRQVREGNFSLDGLVGFNLYGKTVGLIGTGRIGTAVAKILGRGFGCKLLGYDPEPNEASRDLGLEYVNLHQACNRVRHRVAPCSPAVDHCPPHQRANDRPNEERRDADQYQSGRSGRYSSRYRRGQKRKNWVRRSRCL
jgi:D-lactate dehydrogenase